MGIELERFVNTIDDELKCTICCGVLENAVQLTQCEHTFCSECIEEWMRRKSTCPIDRRDITSDDIKPASRLLNSFLNRLNIKCTFDEMGCKSTVTLESLTSHVSQCNYNPDKAFPCEKGCGILLTIKQKNDHNCVLEDILINIENQNVKIRKLEKIIEKDNSVIYKRIEELEKKSELIEELSNKYKMLEYKYEQLVSKLSQISSNNSSQSNLTLEEVENLPKQETIPKCLESSLLLVESKEKSTIFKIINIEIDHKLKTIQLWANIHEPISNIKLRISEKEDMTVQSQCLFYGEQVLSDDKTLNDYLIKSMHLILVKRPIKIDIIIFTENISFLLEPYETVENIKVKLYKLRGFNVSLSYFGQTLEDNRTLYSYKIRDRAKLKVTSIDCNRDKGKSLPKLNI